MLGPPGESLGVGIRKAQGHGHGSMMPQVIPKVIPRRTWSTSRSVSPRVRQDDRVPPPRLTWPVMRARIEGPSMIPTLAPGEEVWVLRTRWIRPGDIAVFRDPLTWLWALAKFRFQRL